MGLFAKRLLPETNPKEVHRIILFIEQLYAREFANRALSGYSAPTVTVTE
jgi:hypothetical protein